MISIIKIVQHDTIDFNIFPSVRSNVKRDWENLEPIKKNSPRISICLEAFPNDDRTLYGLSVLNLLIPKNDAQKNLFDFIRVYYTNYSYATKKQYEFLTKNLAFSYYLLCLKVIFWLLIVELADFQFYVTLKNLFLTKTLFTSEITKTFHTATNLKENF